MSDLVDTVTSALTALPPVVVLVVAFLLPAAEASMFVGLLVPGETAVIVAGVLAHAGVLPLWSVITCASAGAIAGDQVGFQVGRRCGQALLDRLPRWMRRHDRPERVLALVRRRGGVAVVMGRWTASLRALVPGIAGMSGLSTRTFTLANAAGGVVWAVVVALVGYLAGAGYREVEHRANLSAGLAVAGASVVCVTVWLFRRRRDRRGSRHSRATRSGSS